MAWNDRDMQAGLAGTVPADESEVPIAISALAPVSAVSGPQSVTQTGAALRALGIDGGSSIWLKLQAGLFDLFAEAQTIVVGVSGAARTSALAEFASVNTAAPVIGGYVAIDGAAKDGDGAALLATLQTLGLVGGAAVGAAVSGRIPIDALADLAGLDALAFARPAYAATNSGAVQNQGDTALYSDWLRSVATGLTGTGITIGVLSDSFDTRTTTTIRFANDVASGDLPGDLRVLQDYTGGSDEGRAMAQLIYDIAPGAKLAFATANNGQAGFAQNVSALSAISQIVVDDIYYFAAPFFSDGLVSKAVDAAVASGDLYFSSAGNQAASSYQATFVDSGQTYTNAATGIVYRLHDFDTTAGVDVAQRVTQNGATNYVLQWDQPFFSVNPSTGGSANDLALILRLPSGAVIVIADDGNVGLDPVEIAGLTGTGAIDISIGVRQTTVNPGLVKYVALNSAFVQNEYNTASSTSYGHNNSAGAISVAAAPFYGTPAYDVTPPKLENFSSKGGTPILFDANGIRLTTPIFRGVDFAAPDGGNTTFFGTDSTRDADTLPNFFGTSAAAPNAAALAALLWSKYPTATNTQIEAALKASAIDITETFSATSPAFTGLTGPDLYSGVGLIRAQEALTALGQLLGVVNSAPVGIDRTIGSPATGFYKIGFNDLYTDVNGNPLSTLTIGTVTVSGARFTLNGATVVAGQVIQGVDLQNGLLRYVPTTGSEATASGSITFTVKDTGGTAGGGADTDATANTLSFVTGARNAAPTTANINGDAATFLWNGTTAGVPVKLDTGTAAVVADADSTSFAGGYVRLTITNGIVGEDQLLVDASGGGGVGGVFTPGAAIVVGGVTIGTVAAGATAISAQVDLNASATPAAIGAFLNSIRFDDTNGVNPTLGFRNIQILVNDGGGVANGGADTVTIATAVRVDAINVAPAGADTTLTVAEDSTVNYLFAASFGFSDSDGDVFSAVTVALPTAGGLYLNGTLLTAPTSIPFASLQSGLLTYRPAANANGANVGSFTFQVQDNGGTAGGGVDLDPTPNRITFNATPVNDAPTVAIAPIGTGWEQSAFRTTGALVVSGGYVGQDFVLTQSQSLTTFTLYLSESTNTTEGVFDGFGGTLGWAIYSVGPDRLPNGVLFSGSDATPVLTDTGQNRGGTTDIFKVAVNLGNVTLGAGTYVIAWREGADGTAYDSTPIYWEHAQNDSTGFGVYVNLTTAANAGYALQAGNSGAFTLTGAAPSGPVEQVSFDLKGSVSIADIDAGSGVLSVILGVGYGILTVTPGSSNATVTNSGTAAVTIAGTLAQINDLLGANATSVVSFTADTDTPPETTTLTVTANDAGNTGGGGALNGSRSQVIAITAVADAPVGADVVKTVAEDATYTFAATDFAFTDPNDSPANTLVAVTITTVPTTGTLRLGAATVVAGQSIALADIPTLTYAPPADVNGAGAASFTFQVRDSGSTANGGVTLDASPNRLTFDVTPVNDAPTLTSAAQVNLTTITEDQPSSTGDTVTALFSARFTDVTDGATAGSLAGIAVIVNPQGGASGTYQYNSGGGWIDIGTASAGAARTFAAGTAIRYVPPTDATTAPTLQVVLIESGGPAIVDNAVVDAGTRGGTTRYTSTGLVVGQPITAVDDRPVAVADSATTSENVVSSGTLTTNDTDVDGGPKLVASVTGGSVGTQFALTSGALVTVNADGTYAYNPNGKFDYLVSSAKAAGNPAFYTAQATDSFVYALNGGSSTTVTVTITGVDGAGDQLRGGTGNDSITGTAGVDVVNISAGGSDTVSTGDGSDGIFAGAALDAGDVIDAGAGADDQVAIRGSYAGYTLGAGNLIEVETLVVLSGSDTRFGGVATDRFSYVLTSVDANIASGRQLVVTANGLLAGENLTFDGRAETDGVFLFYGGSGGDTLTGGQRSDGFFFGTGALLVTDRIDGQAGADDQIGLRGDYSAGLTFAATTVTGIETIVLLSSTDTRFATGGSGFSYALTLNDANVAAGARLTINANSLVASQTINETARIDGSAETNGSFRFIGGQGADSFTGGAGADIFFGGGGNDRFVYTGTIQSTATRTDQILDFTSGDLIDLRTIDANLLVNDSDPASGGNSAFSYIGNAAFSAAGQLRAVDQGSGLWRVEADTDGDGQADFVIQVTTTGGHALIAADFLL